MRAITSLRIGVVIALLSAFSCLPAQSKADGDDRDFIFDTDNIGRSNGVVMSDQLLELGMVTSNGLRLEGEQCMRLGNADRACMLLQKAVEVAPSDMDGRILYAMALEKKLTKQSPKKRDPKLYNFVIKNWYYVLKKSEFEDQKSQARNHLGKIAGALPRKFERAGKYLSRVLIPEDGSVKVALGGSTKKAAAEKTE